MSNRFTVIILSSVDMFTYFYLAYSESQYELISLDGMYASQMKRKGSNSFMYLEIILQTKVQFRALRNIHLTLLTT